MRAERRLLLGCPAQARRRDRVFVAGERLNQAGSALQRVLRHYRALLGERNVALLLGAGIVSEIGDWFNIVALVSLSYSLGDGALGVGGMFATRMVTRLLCQGPAGAFVDRRASRRLLFTSQLVMAVVAGSFALLVLVPELWLLYLLVILLEMTNCIVTPAFMVELKAEAPLEQRSAANGFLTASMSTAQLVGPLLGALVLAPFGAAAVFALNGVTFLVVAIAVTQLEGGLRATQSVAPVQDESSRPDISRPDGDAISYAWLLRRRDLSWYVLACLGVALLIRATITLFVVRAITLGLGDSGIGFFYAAVAVGSIAGSVVAGAYARHTTPLYPAAVAMALCAMALAIFGAVNAAVLAIVALVIAGFATDFYEVVGLTYFQNSIPDAVYARFISVFHLALSAGGLIGALGGPALEQMLGVGMSLLVLALPSLVFALVLAFTSRIGPVAGPMRSA
jgi:predicted MFS family arabinose efflux permease